MNNVTHLVTLTVSIMVWFVTYSNAQLCNSVSYGCVAMPASFPEVGYAYISDLPEGSSRTYSSIFGGDNPGTCHATSMLTS